VRIHHQEPCQFAIYKNNLPVISAIFSSPTGATQTSHGVIVEVEQTDLSEVTSVSPFGVACKFRLVNHTSYSPIIHINGVSGGGSASPDSTSTMTVILLKHFPMMPL
jgi:hypothetical protein